MNLLEELLAEREIRKVLAQYPQYADDNDVDGWVNLFAENGALVRESNRIEGHQALREMLLAAMQRGDTKRHLMMNQNITVESPTTATVVMDMVLLRAESSGWVPVSAPRYKDKLIKTVNGWKFLERVIDLRKPA